MSVNVLVEIHASSGSVRFRVKPLNAADMIYRRVASYVF
jgi:hypothetical protein